MLPMQFMNVRRRQNTLDCAPRYSPCNVGGLKPVAAICYAAPEPHPVWFDEHGLRAIFMQ